MKTLLHFFDRMSNFTSNLGLKFWWWALETIIHRLYSEGFENKIFTQPTILHQNRSTETGDIFNY
jgi:hypothetical protein